MKLQDLYNKIDRFASKLLAISSSAILMQFEMF